MESTSSANVALEDEELDHLRAVLSAHDVAVALVFGSAGHPGADPSDIDIAVEFAERRPTDDEYTSAYLRLYSALDDALDHEIDLVDVHSLSPRLARVVFDDGVLVLGSPGRRSTLEDRLAGDEPSIAEARDRVAAAATRLREHSS